jgi:hypothetical protein
LPVVAILTLKYLATPEEGRGRMGSLRLCTTNFHHCSIQWYKKGPRSNEDIMERFAKKVWNWFRDAHVFEHAGYPVPILTFMLLTWRIGWAPNNASRWQIKFNSAFKVLKTYSRQNVYWSSCKVPIILVRF